MSDTTSRQYSFTRFYRYYALEWGRVAPVIPTHLRVAAEFGVARHTPINAADAVHRMAVQRYNDELE